MHIYVHMHFSPLNKYFTCKTCLGVLDLLSPDCSSLVFKCSSSQIWAKSSHLVPPPQGPTSRGQSSLRRHGAPVRPPVPDSACCVLERSWGQIWPTGWWLETMHSLRTDTWQMKFKTMKLKKHSVLSNTIFSNHHGPTQDVKGAWLWVRWALRWPSKQQLSMFINLFCWQLHDNNAKEWDSGSVYGEEGMRTKA